jgi:hypothetical protein
MNKHFFNIAFGIGLLAVMWVGYGFVGSSWLALLMTAAIAGVYVLGAFELKQFRAGTNALSSALNDIPQPLTDISPWMERVPTSLQNAVRLRIEGERVALPGPALTPYLVGLLVMLGMLGTFLGMVVTFKGAVFALEGSSDLQAIRAALAAPIKGLGLSFGTSVAGVAASAMLGLISAISRRERLEVVRLLDARIATVFRPLSLVYQRQETFKALQAQSQALPEVVSKLHAMMEGLERRNEQLNQQLLGQQQQFHRDVAVAYTDLSHSVGQSLKDSLTASAKAAGDTIKPVVESAMAEIAQESQRTHLRLMDTTQTQLTGLSTQFEATARTVSETWTQALQTHTQTSGQLVEGVDLALKSFTDVFEQRSHTLLTTISQTAEQTQASQASGDAQRLDAWKQSLQDMAQTLANEWQRVGAQTMAQQQATCQALEATAGQITERASQHVSQTLNDVTQLVNQSEGMIRSRMESESTWIQAQGDRMDQLATVWRTELQALRDEEATRAQAAVARLDELQGSVASHLATLGSALEAPLTRLLQTAAEVPQAASEVIGQLRQEMSKLTARDNVALEERTAIMGQMNTLLQSVNQASSQQQAMIESLVTSAAAVLEKAGNQLSESLGAQAGKVAEVAEHVTSSAIELSSLSESFSHGVALFSDSNDKLVNSLQTIEGSIKQSLTRSDEQLAYYVAQAREVIDLSITSQQGIVEDLRKLHSKQAANAEGAAR